MRIRLEGEGGGLVGLFDIPNFNVPPKVVGWGSRIFGFRHWDHKKDNTEVVYGEVFDYAITGDPHKREAKK